MLTLVKDLNKETINAEHNMNLAYQGFFSFYLAPSSGEIEDQVLVELNLFGFDKIALTNSSQFSFFEK